MNPDKLPIEARVETALQVMNRFIQQAAAVDDTLRVRSMHGEVHAQSVEGMQERDHFYNVECPRLEEGARSVRFFIEVQANVLVNLVDMLLEEHRELQRKLEGVGS